jgi:hypothetical protein
VYANSAHGRFARLEGEVLEHRSVGWLVSPDRVRDSRLVSERLSPDRWRRMMSVSEDKGSAWRVLWVDELKVRAGIDLCAQSRRCPRRRGMIPSVIYSGCWIRCGALRSNGGWCDGRCSCGQDTLLGREL